MTTKYLTTSGEDFEDYCLRTFKCMLHGDRFPYSLRETYHLVFASWNEAVKELIAHGVEGFSYQESPEGDDYLLSMHGFAQLVVMQDETLELLACFCDTTYRQQMAIFDIPVRFETRCEKKDDGQMRIVQVPVNGYQSNSQKHSHNGFMTTCGDLYAKVCFDTFLQKSGLSVRTAEIAEVFGMPEEALLCTLKQDGIIRTKNLEVRGKTVDDESDSSWELEDNFKDKGFTQVKTGPDGKPEMQWTYKGAYHIWAFLTQDCGLPPCYERGIHE